MTWRPDGKQWVAMWAGFFVSAFFATRSFRKRRYNLLDLEQFGINLEPNQELVVGIAAIVATALCVLALQSRREKS